MTKLSLAVQLYTLRQEQAKDFAGTIRQVAEIGYSGVEMAGYGNLKTAREAKKALDDARLKVCGVHAAIEQLEATRKELFQSEYFGGQQQRLL